MPSGAHHNVPKPMHDLVTTVAATACLLGERNGQIRPEGVQGLYVSDARVLHGAEVAVDGREPIGLNWASTGPNTTKFHGIVPGVGDPSPDPTVRLDRARAVCPDGLDEEIRVWSTASEPVCATLSLLVTPDLTSLMAARAGRGGTQPTSRLQASDPAELAWARGGATVTLTAAGAEVDAATNSARWLVELEPGGETRLHWRIRVRDVTAPLVVPSSPPAWSRPAVTAADPRLGHFIERSLDDLVSLRLAQTTTPDDAFIAAGAPWFLTLFGRDSIWAARMMLPLGTNLAETTLRTLAARQGVRVDVASCEEPGKILHELRRGDIGAWPVSPHESGLAVYYGTIDATPLWISLLADAWRWGMSEETVAGFMPHLRNALRWLAEYADPTGDGFVSYVDPTGRGLANQGWKDSRSSVRSRDGRTATPPIALCEVQGYAHRAALDAAELLDEFADGADAARWREYAARLSTRFRDRFWVDGPLGPHPALALDRDGRPVDALTSNIGHLIGTGLLSPSEESSVAKLLGSPTLAGGYGLRTMSDLDAGFDPMSYHCGSIWPHDTAITLLGLATRRDDPHARAASAKLADGLLIAAEAFDYRLPELYGGDSRAEAPRPLPHPAACRPQAWSAAAAIALLQSMLGLSVDAPRGLVSANPLTTGPISVSDLRLAGQPLQVTVDGNGVADLVTAAGPRVGRLPRQASRRDTVDRAPSHDNVEG